MFNFFLFPGVETTAIKTTQATRLNTTRVYTTGTNELSTYFSYVTNGIANYLSTENFATTKSLAKGRFYLYIF